MVFDAAERADDHPSQRSGTKHFRFVYIDTTLGDLLEITDDRLVVRSWVLVCWLIV